MQLLKKYNKYLVVYSLCALVLALPSVNVIFNPSCNFYTDYLTCSYNPTLGLRSFNFIYLLITFFALSFSYYKIIKIGLKIPVKVVGAILFLFFIMVPFGSTDIFYYRGVAKGEIEQSINPYKGGFVKEINIIESEWGPLKPVMYPPIWLQLNKVIYSLSPVNEYLSIYMYKLSAGIFALLTYLVIKKGATENIANMFILNPLVLFEFFTNAHLDAYLIFLMVSSIVLFLKNQFAKSTLLLFVASMVKFTAVFPLPFYHIYDFLSNKKLRGRLKSVSTFLATTTLGALLIVTSYKPYWFGPKTLEGISKQADWPFNTIFERLVFTKLNPFLYFAGGKYNYSSFRDIWLALVFVGLGVSGVHILKNLKLKNLNKVLKIVKTDFSITQNSAIFYSGLLLLVFPTIIMRSFLPWYLIWSGVFFMFAKFKYKFEVIAAQTLILSIYYPTVYLMGHFNVSTGNPFYPYLVTTEILLTLTTLYLLFKSKVKIIA